MSLLFGCYQYETDPNKTAETLKAMYAGVHFFPHEKHQFQVQHLAGFGHMLTYNTPEARFENLPVYLPEEQLLFTAQGRIDNRDELARQLALPINDQYPDGNIILKAYLQWGRQCVKYLKGNWSFAVFNFIEQELFIARDPIGYTSIYYYHDATGFYFSSSIKSLLALPNYHKQLNELYFVQQLSLWEDTKSLNETHFDNIYSLPQGHIITVKNKTLTIQKYWYPENIALKAYKNKSRYIDKMLELFTNAVKARLRGDGSVASMLSGGLDSSSVSYMAAHLLGDDQTLTTFSHVPYHTRELLTDPLSRVRTLDETPFIHEVARAAGNIHPILLNSDSYSVISGMKDFLTIFDIPAHGAVNAYWAQDIYCTAAKMGFGSIVTGEGGNGSISFHGLEYLLPYKIGTLLQHPLLFLRKQVAKPIAYKYLRGLVAKTLNSTNSLEKYIPGVFIRSSVIEKYNILEQVKKSNRDYFLYTDINMLKKLFVDNYNSRGIGGAAFNHFYGFELRDPTVDVDLMEYFFSIPNEVFFDEHYNIRMLVKRMMKGKIPDKVLFEKKKGLQSADIAYRVKAQEAEISATIDSVLKSPAANHYIDLPGLHATWQQYKKQPYVDPYSYQRLLKALHFAMFLQMHFD